MWRVIFSGLFLFCCQFAAASLAHEFNLEREPVSDHLPHSTVKALYQDHLGYLWIGTLGGLCRWDGQTLITFNHDPQDTSSLPNDNIQDIYENSHSRLFIATKTGLAIFDRVNRSFTSVISKTLSRSIMKDSTFYFGTEGEGLIQFNPLNGQVQTIMHDSDDPDTPSTNLITRVMFDSDGDCWLGHDETGIDHFRNGTRIKTYILPPQTHSQSERHVIQELVEDANHLIWVASELRQLTLIDKKRQQIVPVRDRYRIHQNIIDNTVTALFFEPGKMWIGTFQGLYVYDFVKDSCQHIYGTSEFRAFENDFTVKRLYRDHHGILWMGTKSGLYRITERRHFRHLSNFIPDVSEAQNRVWCFLSEGDSLWFGADVGLFKWNRSKNTFQLFSPADDRPVVRSIQRMDERFLSILTLGGHVFTFDCQTNTFIDSIDLSTTFQSHIAGYCTYIDQHKTAWLGTNGAGLVHVTHGSTPVQNFIFPKKTSTHWILDIHPDDSHEQIWCATWNNGLLKFDLSSMSFSPFNQTFFKLVKDEELTILCIEPAEKGGLWLGTNGNGLLYFHPGTAITKLFTQNNGLPSNIIYSLVRDDSSKLWLGTNKGLACFDPGTGTCRVFDQHDGLQGKEFNLGAAAKRCDGMLLFGGDHGFNIINPNCRDNQHPPFISLNDVKIFGKAVHLSQNEIERGYFIFRHYENFITLNFSVLHFLNPRKNKLFYRLKNINDHWIDMGQQRDIILTNMKPGRYDLELLAQNSNGAKTAKPIRYSIQIKPPFWKSAWFYGGSFFFTLIIISLFISWRIRQRLAIERIKESEREAMRKKLAADFHDEVGHRLTKISLLSQLLRNKYEKTAPDIKERTTRVIEHANEIYAEMRGFIWELYADKNSLHDLLVQLKTFGDQLFEDTPIDFELQGIQEMYTCIKLPLPWREHLMRIFKEVMHNVLKHANASRTVLSCTVVENNITIELSDNGRGFDLTTLQHRNGLGHMQERANAINGRLTVESTINQGTQIIFVGTLPD